MCIHMGPCLHVATQGAPMSEIARFAEFVTPQRFAELFPLAATDLPYACRQLCEPIRASALEVSRNPRAKAALLHVLQKEERPLGPCDELGVLGLVPRPLHQQFRKPTPLPFHGSSGSFQSDAQDPRDIGQMQALPRKS